MFTIIRRLAEYIEKPQMEARVAVFCSQKVYVTGKVMKPGEVLLADKPMHVLDAANAAGGNFTAYMLGVSLACCFALFAR